MFKAGDRVVYPMQGIGIVQNIEEKIFSGQKKQYCIIKMLKNNMEIMIPTDRVLTSNLRMISDTSTLENILANVHDKSSSEDEEITSKQRYQLNMDKIKSGSLQDSAEVVYDLTLINKQKALNSSEKQMLNTARKFLIDEITLIKDITESEANAFLKATIN
ncbi:CarD family transcriptional regulator [Clostridium uliginosum]|uniref:CarD family transcriptional regulator n=1 Tax=Clostridium uliginosum TaxID=119641 RepID=A0A1I1RL54_9CLOT|nr:CarD family transcriptional regulator [Clostridium uliginosum]